jgi:hypothetical protein
MNIQRISLALTLIITINTSYAMQTQEELREQQPQSNWQKISNCLPQITTRRVVIGACGLAAGAALWYACSRGKTIAHVVLRESAPSRGNGAAIPSPSQASAPLSGQIIPQTTSAPTSSLPNPSIEQQTAITKPSPVIIDLRDKPISGLIQKSPVQYSNRTGVVAVHTFPQDKSNYHIKCIAVNGLGHELEDFCFDINSQTIITQPNCDHLGGRFITRNVDHIRRHPTEITLGKRKVTFTGPWTMEIEG